MVHVHSAELFIASIDSTFYNTLPHRLCLYVYMYFVRVYMCVCVCAHVCIYIMSSFFLKISPYSNILSSRDAPIHSPFTPVLHRPPRRWTSIPRQAYVPRCVSRLIACVLHLFRESIVRRNVNVGVTTRRRWWERRQASGGYLPPTHPSRSHSRGCSNPVAVRPVRFTARMSAVDSSARFHLPYPRRRVDVRLEGRKIEVYIFLVSM